MILLLHIAIAIASLACTTYLLVMPSRTKLHASYALVAATLVSGTYLVWSTQTHILQACTMGLFYLGLVTFGIVTARRRLIVERVPAQPSNKTDER